jgi:hypothetical protein
MWNDAAKVKSSYPPVRRPDISLPQPEQIDQFIAVHLPFRGDNGIGRMLRFNRVNMARCPTLTTVRSLIPILLRNNVSMATMADPRTDAEEQ